MDGIQFLDTGNTPGGPETYYNCCVVGISKRVKHYLIPLQRFDLRIGQIILGRCCMIDQKAQQYEEIEFIHKRCFAGFVELILLSKKQKKIHLLLQVVEFILSGIFFN
jgi:hypothetical protein